MNSLILAAIVLVVVFAGGAIGLRLQRALPEGYTTGGPRDMIGAVSGLLTLLLALVLGLFVSAADELARCFINVTSPRTAADNI